MGIIVPGYYRQMGEYYPRNASTMTAVGTLTYELERVLGESGVDSIKILNYSTNGNSYTSFVQHNHKTGIKFVDYNKPQVETYYKTFLAPSSIGKKTLKTGKNSNQLAPFISWIGGLVIFASFYMIIRDAKIIHNSSEIINKTRIYQKILKNEKRANPQIVNDPVFQSLNKVFQLREKIYKRTLISAVVSIAMTVSIIALTVIAIAAAIAASFTILLAAAAGAGALVLGHGVKAVTEWKGRLDKKDAAEILQQTEFLRTWIPPHLEEDFHGSSILPEYYIREIKDRPVYNTVSANRVYTRSSSIARVYA